MMQMSRVMIEEGGQALVLKMAGEAVGRAGRVGERKKGRSLLRIFEAIASCYTVSMRKDVCFGVWKSFMFKILNVAVLRGHRTVFTKEIHLASLIT